MTAALPILLVHLDDPETGRVSFKPKDVKGARWKQARNVYDACTQADAVQPTPREINYVLRKE